MRLIPMKLKRLKKPTIIVIIAIIILIGAYFIIKNINTDYSTKLTDSKEKITGLIQQINLLASQSNAQFQLIEERQTSQNYKAALDLVLDEKERNREINETALRLTNELTKLTELLVQIPDQTDREKLQEAIQYQINGISHLLNYGSGVDAVLEELAQKYESILDGRYFEIKRNISQLIALIKEEITEADQNSQEFIQLLSEVK